MPLQGLIQTKNTAVTTSGCQHFGTRICFLLACLYCQKQLKTKIIIKNGIIFIQKSLFKERCTAKNKAPLLN